MTAPNDRAETIATVNRKVSAATVRLRTEFLDEVPQLTRRALAARNVSAEALRAWRQAGKLLFVQHNGIEFYPAFQFNDAKQPLQVVAELLSVLGRDPGRTPWDNALWFAGDTGWLDGARPMDRLLTDPAGVLRAAEQEAMRDQD